MARTIHTARVGSTAAIGGLVWRDVPGEDASAIREQIRAAAAAARSRYGVTLESSSGTQVGILPEPANGTSGLRSRPSAAAWLSHAHSEGVLYIEQRTDGYYWIVRTAAGYVDPRTDVVLEETDASRFLDDLLEQIQASGDEVPQVYKVGELPPSHMLSRHPSEIKDRDYAALVEGTPAPRSIQIKQLVGITPATYLGIVGAVMFCGVLYGGYAAYDTFQKNRAFEARRAELARRDADAQRIKDETELRMRLAVEKAAKEDTATLSPTELIQSCTGALDAFGHRVGGWRIAVVTCDGTGSGITLNLSAPRTSGELVSTAAILMEAAEAAHLAITINPANQSANVVAPHPPMVAREGLQRAAMPSNANVIRGVYSRLQMGRAAIPTLSYQMGAPTPRPVVYVDPALESANDGSQFKQVPPEMTYRKGTLSVRGQGRWALDAISFEYPFLSITKLELRPGGIGDVTWLLEAHYVTNG